MSNRARWKRVCRANEFLEVTGGTPRVDNEVGAQNPLVRVEQQERGGGEGGVRI